MESQALQAPTESSLKRRRIILALLILVLLVSRVPLFSRYLNESDSPAFAIAMEDYDLAAGRPHAPGYILFVGIGKVVNFFIHDANLSFVILSFIFTSLTLVITFLLGRRIFGTEKSLIAVVLLAFNPIFWFYGEVAESYGAESFFSVLVAYLCYLNMTADNKKYWYLSAVALALAGGIRQNILVFLFPLWLYCQLRRSRSIKDLALGLILCGACVAAWYLPLIHLTGGYARYKEITFDQLHTALKMSSPFFTHGRVTVVANITRFFLFHFMVLSVLLVPLAWNFCKVKTVWQTLRSLPRWILSPVFIFFALWFIPAATFYLLFHIAKPGYLLTYISGIYLLGGFLTYSMAADLANFTKIRIATAALILTVFFSGLTASFFLFWPNYALNLNKSKSDFEALSKEEKAKYLIKASGAIFCIWTAQNIKDTDLILDNYLNAIRKYNPQDSVIVHVASYSLSGQQLIYYLREFKIFVLIRELQKVFCSDKWLYSGNCDVRKGEVYLGTQVKNLIYIDDRFHDTNLRDNPEIETVSLPLNRKLYVIPASGRDYIEISRRKYFFSDLKQDKESKL